MKVWVIANITLISEFQSCLKWIVILVILWFDLCFAVHFTENDEIARKDNA